MRSTHADRSKYERMLSLTPGLHGHQTKQMGAIMDGLNQIIGNLQGMRQDMAKLSENFDAMAESRVLEYIETADMQKCKDIIDALANRVVALCGDASSLEDAACQLEAEIDAKEAIDNPPLCAQCNGSGEGQYDGTTCRSCKGRGTVMQEAA